MSIILVYSYIKLIYYWKLVFYGICSPNKPFIYIGIDRPLVSKFIKPSLKSIVSLANLDHIMWYPKKNCETYLRQEDVTSWKEFRPKWGRNHYTVGELFPKWLLETMVGIVKWLRKCLILLYILVYCIKIHCSHTSNETLLHKAKRKVCSLSCSMRM